MIFSSRKSNFEANRHGIKALLSTSEAVTSSSRASGAAVVSSWARELDGAPAELPPNAALGLAIGQAAAGQRSIVALCGADLLEVQAALVRSSGNHIPLVIRHHARYGDETGHRPYLTMRDSGCFQLMAGDLQEALDLELIAHRIAERALVPGICSQDVASGPSDVFTVRLPDPEGVAEFLGRPEDAIESPTPSQKLVFGESRRRIPRLLDLDRPAGMGARLDDAAGGRSLAGQGAYFLDHVETIARDAFDEYGRLTGRLYQAVDGYRIEDADYVVVAQGAVCEPLRHAVDSHRSRGSKVGLVVLRMLRPFPGAQLCSMLRGKKKVTVLETVTGAMAGDPPLAGEIRRSFDRAIENGQTEAGTPVHAGYPRFARPSDRPAIYSAISSSGGLT
jgi:pyruvate-ferredoxin/flavodoxin oxidoreductase